MNPISAPHLSILCLVGAAVACSAPAAPVPDAGSSVGTLELLLQSDSNGVTYELRDAVFQIEGPEELTLSSSEMAAPLVQELPEGDYRVELLPGWQLFEVGSTEAVPLLALLTSPNPTSFTINSDQMTPVAFAFSVLEEPVASGSGTVQVEIDVTRPVSRALLFSEIMSNPAALADSAGEWFEILNAGSQPADLSGCVVRRDTSEVNIDTSLVVAPGDAVVLANGATPGFSPDWVYSGLTLPNSAVFVLELACGGELLDALSVDPGSWPGGNGVAASLSGAVQSPADNDAASAWCDANGTYGVDFGSPGAPNPTCP